MSLSPLDRPGEWTFDELVRLPDDGRRWEVVDGVLLAVTPPTRLHEHVVDALRRQLEPQLPGGWAVATVFGLRLGTDGRLPDLGIVRDDVAFAPDAVGREPGEATLLIEVVSRSSRKNDRFFKPIEYAQAGVPAFWRVEVQPEVFVVAHELVGSAYHETATARDVLTVEQPFPLRVSVTDVLPPHLRGATG